MATINISLEKQLLTIQNREIIASGDSNYDVCAFFFDEAWEGFTKTAVFYQDKSNVQYAVLDNKDSCTIPAGAMYKKGKMHIGVFGIKNTAVLTSTLDDIEIEEGAISGDNVSTEPTDDVFLAIIAQYQRIVELMQEYDETAAQVKTAVKEQNDILSALNAFDVVEVSKRITKVEMETSENKSDILKNFRINELKILFDQNSEFKYLDKRITRNTLIDVFFDNISMDIAAEKIIVVETFDGYILFTSTYKCEDELMASIWVMGE